ncbi:hypothetical protein SteCoe_2843 [Stentor coeruleus]|uniref:Uncharacterized protein n=1 Tax=Stentor coeruleus TaxID=5963 RepID=A0A1R2CYK5_9CILI|nr:hypothetical protein SteCoe_2843 [Stentor coeruleus]
MKLETIGFIALGAFLSDPLFIAYKTYYWSMPDIYNRYGHGSYALVTGATDGIGKGFCEALAEKGINIILVSRTQEKLDKVANELSKKYGVSCVTHAIDLSKAKAEEYAALKKKTDSLDMSMLINNAGVVCYKKTKELTFDEIQDTINLNSGSVMHLLNMYLPVLEQRKGRSAVINLSSFLAVRPSPLISLYSGTKAFNHYVSQGLSEEYRDSIDVMSYQPATIITNATPNEKPSWRSCTVEESVRGALIDLGRRNLTHGHWNHELMAWAVRWVPEKIRIRLMAQGIDKIIKQRFPK